MGTRDGSCSHRAVALEKRRPTTSASRQLVLRCAHTASYRDHNPLSDSHGCKTSTATLFTPLRQHIDLVALTRSCGRSPYPQPSSQTEAMVNTSSLFLLLWPAALVVAQSPSSSSSSGASSASSTSGASSVSSTSTPAASGSLTATPTSSAAFPSLSGVSPCGKRSLCP